MSGFFLMHRGWRDNPIFRGEFSRADAWVWLIENAAWKPTRIRIKGETVELDRGELSFSVRFLAESWGWSKSRVDRFIADLRAEGMIETRSKIGTPGDHKAGQGQSIIKICNYEKYQDHDARPRDNSGTTSGTTAGQQRDKEEQVNKGTREEEEPIGSPSPLPREPEKPDPCDEIFVLWNEMAGQTAKPDNLPTCSPTPKRRTACKARLREHGIDAFRQAIDRIPRCSFVLGINDRGWKGDIDWLLRPDSVTKILEGKYDDRPAQQSSHAPRDTRDGLTRALHQRIAGAGP